MTMDLAYIRALAEEYALKYNPEQVAPFPYENILKDKDDLEIYFVPLEDDTASGVTLYKDRSFTILVNNIKPETRQHFTLGHELSHYVLHQAVLKEESAIVDEDTSLDGSGMLHRLDDAITTKLEIEANNFAASLLMPIDLVRRAWQATENVEECARIFKVSVVAMSVRLAQLGMVSG